VTRCIAPSKHNLRKRPDLWYTLYGLGNLLKCSKGQDYIERISKSILWNSSFACHCAYKSRSLLVLREINGEEVIGFET
jgi:hypothetical protein